MYYDDNVKININWKGLILKVTLIIIAVLLIIWFFPMPKLDTFYNRIYNDNLATMREVSENYFAGDKLPENTGSSVTLKLQDMLDKKLITSFTDKNNNTCSTTNSYAQVTKTDNNNYVLKVQLSCDDKTDYILENLNTKNTSTSATSTSNSTNVSSNDNDKNTTTDNSEDDGIEIDKDILESADPKYDKDSATIEYQYKRAITKTSTSYTCPEGYVRSNNVCYREATGETIDATPLYFEDIKEETDAKKNETGSYTKTAQVIKEEKSREKVCPEGYTLNGNICYKYVNATVVPGTTTYSCPEGYTLNGTTCTLSVNPTTTVSPGKTTYTCPNGGTLSGTKCIYNATKKSNNETYYVCPKGGVLEGTRCTYNATRINDGKTTYTCPNGGTLSGTKCTYSATKKTTKGTTTCKCPSGYKDNGSNCVKTTTTSSQYHAGSSSYGNCPSGYSASGSQCVKKSSYAATANVSWSNPTTQTSSTQLSTYSNSTGKRVQTGKSCTLKGCTYTYVTYTAKTTYSCPNGGTLSGNTCTITDTKARPTNNSSGYYTCNGSKTNSSSCTTKSYADKTCTTSASKTTYTCPNGGTLSGKKCTYNATKKTTNNSHYVCPNGGGLNGTTCVYEAEAKKATSDYYVCPNGGTLSGTTCTYDASASSTGDASSISCPAGYTMSGNSCIKQVEATAHTSQTEYTCPLGYVREGTTCYQYVEPTTKINYSYTCPEGYDASGEGENTKCSKYVESTTTYYCESEEEELVGDKCIKTVKGGIKGYSCPFGYISDKDKCYVKTTETIDATEVTDTQVTYEYKWSSESSLDGWTFTGKTRTLTTQNNNNTNLYEK